METANKLAEFEALLEESFESGTPKENTVVNGTIIAIEAGQAIIDIGYKMEGRVDVREFANSASKDGELKIGDKVEVYLERVENSKGEAVVSREKARREEAWDKLEIELIKSVGEGELIPDDLEWVKGLLLHGKIATTEEAIRVSQRYRNSTCLLYTSPSPRDV